MNFLFQIFPRSIPYMPDVFLYDVHTIPINPLEYLNLCNLSCFLWCNKICCGRFEGNLLEMAWMYLRTAVNLRFVNISSSVPRKSQHRLLSLH
jgi:hypothetical protein